MNDSRVRIAIGVLLPVFIASIFFTAYVELTFEGVKTPGLLAFYNRVIVEALIASLIYASVLAGVQSIIYSFLMEKIINPKVHNNVLVYLYSSLLGVVCALLAGLVARQVFVLSVFGAFTGFIVGIVLRKLYLKKLPGSL